MPVLNSDKGVQVSDTTNVDSSNAAGYTIITLLLLLLQNRLQDS